MNSSTFPGYKKCTACEKPFKESDIHSHLLTCRTKTKSIKKICPICDQQFDSNEYKHHLDKCSQNVDECYGTPPETNPIDDHNDNDDHQDQYYHCPFCSQWIQNRFYENHLNQCSTTQINQIDRTEKRAKCNSSTNETKICPLCSKAVRSEIYPNHFHQCSTNEKINLIDRSTIRCLKCQIEFDDEKREFVRTGCSSFHWYCYSCFIKYLTECLNSNEIIFCHRTNCSYELSTIDLERIPLQHSFYSKLIEFIRLKQRNFCSICQFYYDEKSHRQTFVDHQQICSHLIRCEYCQWIYSNDIYLKHVHQCQRDGRIFEEKFISFVFPRLKFELKRKSLIWIYKKYFRDEKKSNFIEDFLRKFDEMKFLCQICFEEKSLENLYVLQCPNEDFLCFQCFHKYLSDRIENDELFLCPFCSFRLIDEDFNEIHLRRFASIEKKRIDEIEFRHLFDEIRCPNGFCSWKKTFRKTTKRFCVECRQCSFKFCSICSDKYHYRTDCHDIPLIRHDFIFWIQQNSSKVEKQMENLKRHFDEFVQDEIYKSRFCRHCPSCQRLIQYLNGCQTIVCGEDAHQSNSQQIGCRTVFQWSKAKFYQPKIYSNSQQIFFDQQQFRCDQCQRHVQSIRFQCIFCSSLSFCFDCFESSIIQHWKDNRRSNEKEHLFTLIRLNDDQSSIIDK